MTTRATTTEARITTEAETEPTTEPETPPETEPESVHIYLSVDCVNALSASDGSAADIAGALTGNGYLYGPAVVTLPAGSSAYDALAATGLSVSASNTSMGLYIRAIQGLAEKDGGSQSGWMYLVDGSPPMQSADSYILSDGSALKWRYTLTQGGDIYFD